MPGIFHIECKLRDRMSVVLGLSRRITNPASPATGTNPTASKAGEEVEKKEADHFGAKTSFSLSFLLICLIKSSHSAYFAPAYFPLLIVRLRQYRS